jgi:transcription-repair coupling factor (superfamily II helicase)
MDRFGPLPSETRNLIEVIRLKIRARQLGIEAIETTRGELVFRVSRQTRIDPHRLARMLERPGCPFRVTPDHQILTPLRKHEDALAESVGLLDLLDPEQNKQHDQNAAGGTG